MRMFNKFRESAMPQLGFPLIGWIFLISLLLFGVSLDSHAKKLRVANNGVDGIGYGGKRSPCRSISQAIANAIDGDKIVVGPGRYGDLNNNGDYTDPGDEAAEVLFPGCICMIKVDKRLRFISTDGAEATVLDVTNDDIRGVVIQVNEVVFGKRKGGFQIINSRRAGLLTEGSTSDVTVKGNIAIGNGSNGQDAFKIQGSGHTVKGNHASNNFRAGFGISGDGHRVISNIATGNLLGFEFLGLGGRFSRNAATNNSLDGITINTHLPLIVRRNNVIGNGQFGIRIHSFAEGTIIHNNIYGNATIPNTEACGLFNSTDGLVDAAHNFWGSPDGPGPDPADEACDGIGAVTITDPFATKEFNIKVDAGS